MKAIEIQLPDKIASELDALVKEGWFASESDLIHVAVADFVRRYRFVLMEQHQLDDIRWAVEQKRERK